MTESHLIRARPRHATVVAMLTSAGLPAEDLEEQQLEHFFYSGSDGALTGLVGLELYESQALLRSLVVQEPERTRGIGMALVSHAEHYAASHGARSIYLLTMTAAPYFKRLGYRNLDRSLAPPSIQRTREFAGLCPASSAFLYKSL